MPVIRSETWQGFDGCVRLSNGVVDVVVSTMFGPRVLHYGFTGGENLFGWHPSLETATPWGPWHVRGGHRLWAAPEALPRSYAPDDDSLTYTVDGDHTVHLHQEADRAGLRKDMSITLDPSGTGVTVRHRLTHEGLWTIEVAPWALTVLRGGGVTILPQEPWRAHGDALTPARAMVLWPYTDMTDPRWTWGARSVLLRSDASRLDPQKVGATNRVGWCAYQHERTIFVKRFGWARGATYPDLGCNCEAYTAGDFVEIESLGPLQRLEPGESTADHVERWSLLRNVTVVDDVRQAVDDALAEIDEPSG